MLHRPFAGVAMSLLLVVAACGDAPAPEEEAEASTATAATAETTSSMALLDPNLASAEELAGATGLSAEAAQAIVDGRPYLTAADFHNTVSQVAGADPSRIYESVWLGVNLNDVTEEEILLIPGMDARMAHEFEEYRPYTGMAEFRTEIGKYVDEDEVERLARYVFVPIDLNTATRDEIMAIPGMDERMAHEFEEYRPYADMDRFRTEIGKYVDEDEVARLERYVTIN